MTKASAASLGVAIYCAWQAYMNVYRANKMNEFYANILSTLFGEGPNDLAIADRNRRVWVVAYPVLALVFLAIAYIESSQ